MENRGVLLYVDLGRLEDEPYRLSKIYDTLGQYIDDIRRQRDIIYISKMAESLDISSLDRYRAQLVDEYDRLGTLKKVLDEAYDLYKECNEKFEASGQTLCNLYAETPWYETSEGKLAIGIGVLVVTAAVAIVCPAVLGAAAATVTQSIATSAIIGAATSGVMNGIASMNSGKSFYDGFASGFESGAILGAISGGLGAGTSAIMSGAELTVGRVMAVKAMNMVSDATVDSVVYAYHSNKYDKDFTGGDIVKTWVKSAATSFAMQSVGSGKSSSKTDGGNGVISTGKGRGEPEGSFKCKTSYGKSIENTEFFKENGGLDASDYISIHSRKHMYDPDTVSTPKKTQYGKDVNVGKLCEDTIMKPDEVIYNKDQNVMIYKKEYPFNISTSDTPTGTHRVFIPLNTQGKKTIRMSQFPLVGGN